jgi:hypothetical protein
MFPKSRYLLIVILFVLAACVPAATSAPSSESPVTQVPVTQPPTKLPVMSTKYFEGFPPEYQDMTLPQEIIDILDKGGSIVPLPVDPSPFQENLKESAQSFGYDLTTYDVDRVIAFTSDQDYAYIAAPTLPEFAKDESVGVIYDVNGAYNGISAFYEVRFLDDKAVLRNAEGLEISFSKDSGEFFLSQTNYSSSTPLMVFVKNGCWVCGCIFGRCGCLICK